MHFKVLMGEGFGGRGGIAKFNRDFLTALCSHPACASVTAFPRLMPDSPGPLPRNLSYVTDGLNSKTRYVQSIAKEAFSRPKADLLFCGHINLLPLARLLQIKERAPLALIVHGIEAWQPTRKSLANHCARRVQAFLAVSSFTKERFLGWTGLRPEQGHLLPNSIAIGDFGPGTKDKSLTARYGLKDHKVLFTLGRLSEDERYKGLDEVLQALPALAREVPNIVYMVAGSGNDRARLEQKAADLGLEDRVIFTGYVPEEEKAAHYRLADAFVLPGWGEGFGIVYLEAMACGIPVVASKLDASREAVRDGELGILVNPRNPAEIQAGILEALRRPKGIVPKGLDYFSFQNFCQRCHGIVDQILGRTDKTLSQPSPHDLVQLSTTF
jgi:glycosyltransferase involved in cell wall biosynthesis